MQKERVEVEFGIRCILIASALLFAGCEALKLGHLPRQSTTTQIQARLFDDPVLKTARHPRDFDKGTVTRTRTSSTELEKADRGAHCRPSRRREVGCQPTRGHFPARSEATTTPQPAHNCRATPRSRPLQPRSGPSALEPPGPTLLRPAPAAISCSHEAPPPRPQERTHPQIPHSRATGGCPGCYAAPLALPAPPAAAPPAPAVKPPSRSRCPSGTILSVRMMTTSTLSEPRGR